MKTADIKLEEAEFTNLAEFYKIFGDPTRLKILISLKEGEISVNDLSKKVNMNQSAVSHQLRILKQARLVKVRRDGKNAFYSFDDEHISLILKLGIEHILEV
jgi:DNA-binding transcriptional ArsR family regulator